MLETTSKIILHNEAETRQQELVGLKITQFKQLFAEFILTLHDPSNQYDFQNKQFLPRLIEATYAYLSDQTFRDGTMITISAGGHLRDKEIRYDQNKLKSLVALTKNIQMTLESDPQYTELLRPKFRRTWLQAITEEFIP